MRRRAVVSALLVALLAPGLSACGRKGKLQPPPPASDPPVKPDAPPDSEES